MEETKPTLYFGYTAKQLMCCVICYFGFLVFGGTDASRSVFFPLIQSYYHLEYDFQGILVSVSSVGYTIFSLFVGYLANRLGVKWTMILGFLILILTFGGGVVFVKLWFVFFSLIVSGIGNVFLDVGTNTWATVLFQSHKAVMMNMLHCFYGLGATIGPVLTGYISRRMNISYRGAFFATFAYCVLALFVSMLIPKSESKLQKEEEEEKSDFTILSALKHPVVWLLGFAQGCIAGTETITMSWAPIYLRDLYGWDPETRGARFVSVFFLVYTISRVVSGFFIDYFGGMRSLFLYVCILITLFVIGFVLGERGIPFLMATGFFIAPLFPTLLTIAMTYFQKNVSKCTCAILFIYMIVSPLIQLFVGFIMKHMGTAWGYRFVVVVMSLLLIDLLVINCFLKKKEKQEEEVKNLVTNEVVLSVC